MRLYSCNVRLKGSLYNEVPKINVTAAEIHLLRFIHSVEPDDTGDSVGAPDPSVVSNIAHVGDIERTDEEERARLADLYNPALNRHKAVRTINGIFGIGTPLPRSIPEADNVVSDKPVKPTSAAVDQLSQLETG